MEYKTASHDFETFLADVAEQTELTTRHQAYTTAQAVFICFRRRFSLPDIVAFAQVLPAMLRALFVQDWDTTEPRINVWDKAVMAEEVRRLRIHHNFSPGPAIRDVACVLRRYVETEKLEQCLARLPPPARELRA